MRILSRQTFKISDLALPADFETTKLHPDVPNLAESIKTHGLIQEPGVEKGSNSLDWGRKRVAAFLKLGQSHIPVAIVEYDYPEEKEIITLRENLDRHEVKPEDRRRFRARIAELEEKRAERERDQEEAAWPDTGPTVDLDPEFSQDGGISDPTGALITDRVSESHRGRPSKGRAEAAKKLGISPGQLRKDLRKAKKEAAGEAPEPEALGIPDHGLTLDEETTAEIKGALADFEEMARCLRKAHKLARGRASLLHEDLIYSIGKDLKAIEGHTPAMVCPHCACRPRLKQSCEHCLAHGWISKDAAAFVPSELLDLTKGKRVYLGGKLVKASTL